MPKPGTRVTARAAWAGLHAVSISMPSSPAASAPRAPPPRLEQWMQTRRMQQQLITQKAKTKVMKKYRPARSADGRGVGLA